MSKIKCPICDTPIEDKSFESFCSVCSWGYSGMEEFLKDDEIDDYNLMTRKKAKELFAKGLNKYGEPIKK